MGNYQKLNSSVRDMRDGNWYWIPKEVIYRTPKIRAIGIAVYNFLASLVDNNQSCFPSQKYIAESLGYSRTTISRTIKILEENSLIKIKKRDRYHLIYYLIKVRCKAYETQMLNIRNSDVNYTDTNNTKLTRNINNNVNRNFLRFNSFKGFIPKTKEELLAKDLAEELNDEKSLPIYLYYCKKYPESLVRKTLGKVKETPHEKIKKNKAALFNYLIKKYAQSKGVN